MLRTGMKDQTKRNKEVIFKTCSPTIECARLINNTQIDHAKDLDLVMLMCNLTEYSNNYSKTS